MAFPKILLAVTVLLSGAALVLGFALDPVHDYFVYQKHWEMVLAGEDPWQKMVGRNAYGPVYNLFALPYALWATLPKVLFVASWLAVGFYAVHAFFKLERPTYGEKLGLWAFWFLNPFFWVGAVGYGFNDNFVAMLTFFAMVYAVQKNDGVKATWLVAVGFLTKLYPLFLVPFLEKRREDRKRRVLLFAALFAGAYALSYLVWGESCTAPFEKANGRGPTLFSVMRFVNGAYFFPGAGEIISHLGKLVVVGGIGWTWWAWTKGRIRHHAAFLLAFTFLLAFYNAGQQQFFIAYFAIATGWLLAEYGEEAPNRAAAFFLLLMGIWFAVMAGLVYPFTGSMHGEWEGLREWIGLPTFLMELGVLVTLIRGERRR